MRLRRSGVLLPIVIVVALLVPGLIAGPAQAATGRVRGTITGAKGDPSPKVKVTWFTQRLDVPRLAQGARRRLLAGPEPGTYHLQFTDQRPAYDVEKYYPADVKVSVSGGATSVKNVKLHRGAAIGGTIRAEGRPAGARVVAANKEQNSFETTANAAGQYALGACLRAATRSSPTTSARAGWQEHLPAAAQGGEVQVGEHRADQGRAGSWSTCTPATSPTPGSRT